MLSAISEPVVGAAVVRSYAVEDRTQARIDDAIDEYKAASTRAQGFTAFSFSLGGISAGLANAGRHHHRRLARLRRRDHRRRGARLRVPRDAVRRPGADGHPDPHRRPERHRRLAPRHRHPRDPRRPGRPRRRRRDRCRAGPIDVRFEHVDFAYPGGPARCCATSTSTIAAGTRRGHRRRDRLGQVHLRQAAHPADGPVGRARCCSTASTCARSRRTRCGAAWCWCRRRASSSTTPWRPTCATAGSTPPTPSSCASADELGLADWLATLPRGLDTRVGQRGESLSAGERQLVALRPGPPRRPRPAGPRRGHQRRRPGRSRCGSAARSSG